MLEQELRDCFRVLELPATASMDDVRYAYRLLSRVWHPDRFAGNPDLVARATARQQALNAAYQKLADAHTRGFTPPPQESRATRSSQAGPAPTNARASTLRPGSQTARLLRRHPLAFGGAGLLATFVLLSIAAFLRTDGPIRSADGAPVQATVIATGSAHGCAAAGARVLCWGDNELGQRGGTDRAARAVPQDLPDTVAALAAGLSHTCALLVTGRVRCWGGNYSGQLGDQSLEDRTRPSAVRLAAQFTTISALAYHTCGVTRDRALHCWGNDTDGQLGVGRPVAECRWDELRFFCSDRPEHIAPGTSWRDVAAGGSHSCAIAANGRVWCWGSNRSGQLGGPASEECRGPDGAQPCRRSPALVSGVETAVAIGAGAAHSCALDAAGRVFCWGLNQHGQTGAPIESQSVRPAALNTSLRFVALAVGGYHSCAVTEDRALYCWGSDARDELRGQAHTRCNGEPCATRPVRVVHAGVSGVAAGFGSTCIRRNSGEVVCWGDGEDVAPQPPRPLAADRAAKRGLEAAIRAVRWQTAVVKRIVHRNLVAPLAN